MADSESLSLIKCLERVQHVTEDIECFLNGKQNTVCEMLESAKLISDLSFESQLRIFDKESTLEKLHVNNFDLEQIWQMIQMNNEPLVQQLKRKIGSMNTKKLCTMKNIQKRRKSKGCEEFNDNISQNIDSESSCETDNDAVIHPDDGDSEEFEGTDQENDQVIDRNKKRNVPRSVVDDGFFVLDEMNKFLDMEDKKFNRKSLNEQNNDLMDEIDYFNDQLSDVDSLDEMDNAVEHSRKLIGRNSGHRKKNENAGTLMFADYFDPPEFESALDKKSVENMSGDKLQKSSEIIEQALDDFSDASQESESVSEEISKKQNEKLSKYAKESTKMKEKIKMLEDQNISKKKWQEIGETTASKRPKNSLLEENLVFDQTHVGAPTVTEETTATLEDLIKQRIRDEAWDDVVRMVKPTEKSFEYKKNLSLDQEKSKISLAEVYEKEYIKQTQNLKEDEENPAHETIRSMMNKLFAKLDALSNYTFTPKQIQPELQIISDVPSLKVEECTPITISTQEMLAPEEIFDKKKHEVKGDVEKSITDRKRERREKKTKKRQQLKIKAKKSKQQEMLTKGNLKRKSSSNNLETVKTKSKNAKIVESDPQLQGILKSSSSFFNQLQENAAVQVNQMKVKAEKRNKKKQRVEGMKL